MKRTLENLAIGLGFAGAWWLVTRSPVVAVVAFLSGFWPGDTPETRIYERIRSAWLASTSMAVIALYRKL